MKQIYRTHRNMCTVLPHLISYHFLLPKATGFCWAMLEGLVEASLRPHRESRLLRSHQLNQKG